MTDASRIKHYRGSNKLPLELLLVHHVLVNNAQTADRQHLSGFVGDPWLSIMLTLCHILHSISHLPVLVYFINT
jgi:hypothetical protein